MKPGNPPKPAVILIVEDAEPGGAVPFIPRLRRLLKQMLRGYGIRVKSITPELIEVDEAATSARVSQVSEDSVGSEFRESSVQ